MKPKIYTLTDHDIDHNLIDSDALYVIQKLNDAGHTAYLVGGSVRDLLLKRTPKDFDVSTSALPEQIKQVFHRKCLLIGRRFRLAHVRFGHKVIEVSTFRSGEEDESLVMQDNQWGTPEQDVRRRDFTINGLFYDPITHSVIDYVGGWEDIHSNTLKVIGIPEIRFKQDPVRMIRLIKFRARFGFNIAPEARQALFSCQEEILKSSQARLLEEMLRMMESGASSPFFNLLNQSGILSLIYPSLAEFLQTPNGKEVFLFLSAADKINQRQTKKAINRPVLFAAMLFPIMQNLLHKQFLDEGKIPHLGEIIMLAGATIKLFSHGSFTHFPRRLTTVAASILVLQYRLTPLSPKKSPYHPKVLKYREFSDALLLLKLRAMVDKNLIDVFTIWKTHYKDYHHRHSEVEKKF